MPGPISDTYQGPNDHEPWIECWQCSGIGLLAGCFEDCCSGTDCDPEDAEYCCAPTRCDVCKGKGGWNPDEPAPITTGQQTSTTNQENDNG